MAKQKNRSATLLFLAIIGLAFAGYVIINGGLTGSRAPVVEDTVVRLNPDNPRQLLVTLIGTRFSPVPMENMVAFGERKFHPVKSGRNFLTIALPVSADLVGGGRLHGLLASGDRKPASFTLALPPMNRLMFSQGMAGVGPGHGEHPQAGQEGADPHMMVQAGAEDQPTRPAANVSSGAHMFFSDEDAKQAADFTLEGPDGKMISLSDFRGQAVLVNFWASWCDPCIAEIPSLEVLQRSFQTDQLRVLAVTVDENWEDVDGALHKGESSLAGTPLMLLRDPEAKNANGWGTEKFPETYVVDGEGKIVAKFIGSRRWSSPLMINFMKQRLLGGGAHP